VILVLNAGSSSVKFAVFEPGADGAVPSRVAGGIAEGLPDRPVLSVRRGSVDTRSIPLGENCVQPEAIGRILDWVRGEPALAALSAVGHRVVHGGGEFGEPVRVDDRILERLESFVSLAPLHQPHNLAAIRAVGSADAAIPQFACFDTAFHATMPALHRELPVPAAWRARGVRRYGFHGLSYEWVASRLPDELGEKAHGRVVVAHLGNGASVCGMTQLRSVRTSMGMTALDGLVMGTRPGALDVGVALFAMETMGLQPRELARALYNDCGLLGLSGVSNDVRTLLASDDPRCAFALDFFCERAAQEIAATAVALGGIDALVFTAGIGENSPPVRSSIVRRLAWLGLKLDPDRNAANSRELQASDSTIPIRIVATDEETVIASAVARQLRR
jgi:acetate kinase